MNALRNSALIAIRSNLQVIFYVAPLKASKISNKYMFVRRMGNEDSSAPDRI